MGTSTFLKEKNKAIKIVGAQPEEGSSIPGIRKWSPEYVPKIFNPSKVDQIIEVSETEAKKMTQRLAIEEGVFAGMSSGGCVASALKLIETIEEGIVVAIVCDRGDRYLSSNLFE
jgi:cysteine synthase B